ncbi:MAG: hypothetical protein ACKV2Q_02655 [Planctomycetaceae bacterium]
MVDVKVSLYLVSHERIARLQKTLTLAVLPRRNEFVKLRTREQGDYFAFSVVQVTHREDGPPEIWLNLTSFVDGRSVADFIEDGELDEYIESYKQEVWTFASLAPNRTFKDTGESFWSELAASDEDG